MKKRTRAVTAAAAIVIAAAAIVAVVYAYIQREVEEPNRFTIGEDVVTVEETFPTQPYQNMSDEFTKVVAVKNTGTSDQYVRVYLDFSDSTLRDRKIVFAPDPPESGEEKTVPAILIVYPPKEEQGQEQEDSEKSWEDFLNDMATGVNGWVYVSDVPAAGETPEATKERETLGGYFYYTKVLEPGETTPPLIKGIKTDFRLAKNDTDTDKITDFDVIVYTESVQTVEPGTGKVYTSAANPPENPEVTPADPWWKTAWINFLTRSSG